MSLTRHRRRRSEEQRYMAEQQAQSQRERERVLATIETEAVRFVNLEFTDVVGMAKCVTIPVEQFPACLEHGKWFDGSALEGFARVAESDMYLFPDVSTFAILPDEGPPKSDVRAARLEAADLPGDGDVVARVICDVLTPVGERFDG